MSSFDKLVRLFGADKSDKTAPDTKMRFDKEPERRTEIREPTPEPNWVGTPCPSFSLSATGVLQLEFNAESK